MTARIDTMVNMFARLPLLLLANLLLCGLSLSQDAYPEVTKFAKGIENITWNLRGTSGLKHLKYDGKSVFEIKPGGRQGSPYEHAFVDAGVLRLNFRGANTGWYFFSDDLKYVTPTTVAGEINFKASGGSGKRIASFPRDIEGVTWESIPDERKIKPGTLRWNGRELEIGAKNGETWVVDKVVPVIANRRVLEVIAPDGSVIWCAFSEDGKEAWLLQLENIFGGYAESTPSKAALTAQETGLTPQLNDLANHAEDLKNAGERGRLDTLRRQFQRKLKDNAALSQKVTQRLATP
ncbi:hypothetical protein [Roseimicrobium sp. ORNL1]|uniref:hypothetical protein n=1 Tax=Roseimicrobium sp. ORNL1 TaxID=2711231 RepID=UPI0013E1D678|nr:hypothetical protein [Roseimicrobium sp. ORNL1]QIF00056.1 hypothetical protein G5S37_00480 [Roseimicrobium sp. ORNL1]